MHTLPEILAAAESGELETNGWVLPIESVFTPLPASARQQRRQGAPAQRLPDEPLRCADGRYRTYDETGAFLGLASVEGGVLKVENYFAKGADCPMQIYQSLTPIHAPQGSAVALGYFDGVHCGHRAVLGAAVECARAGGLTAAAFTFELPASSTLKGGRILSLPQKHARVASLGIEEYQEAPFDEFRALTPEDFVQKVLVGCFNAKQLFCGDNFTFGARAAGNVERLRELCAPLGISAYRADGAVNGGRPSRRLRIRAALEEGCLDDANAMLGTPLRHRLARCPRQGHRQRKAWHADAEPELPRRGPAPCAGVYLTRIYLDGQWWPAATGIGKRPTVDSRKTPP